MNLPVSPEYLEASLRDGFSQHNIRLAHRTIGELMLPTGDLVACDPFVDPRWQPFLLSMPRGGFPLILSIAEFAADQRVAFAHLRFAQTIPVRWQMLTVRGQDLFKLKDGEMFGYPVDSGTGCFVDRSAAVSLDVAMSENSNYYESLTKEMDKTYRHTWSWLNVSFGEANLIAFSSGYGDGLYATYAGFDSSGAITAVVTDFGVLPTRPDSGPPLALSPGPKRSGLKRLWDSLRGRN